MLKHFGFYIWLMRLVEIAKNLEGKLMGDPVAVDQALAVEAFLVAIQPARTMKIIEYPRSHAFYRRA